MAWKPLALSLSRHFVPPTLDRLTAERVGQWVARWHGADYEPSEIAEMLEGWPVSVRVDTLLEPFESVAESESAAALAALVLDLIRLVERGLIEGTHARGAFRAACSRLCKRGIPFEETAKGDESALWFHFIGTNEFGDTDNTGYPTDLSELRLLARQLVDPKQLAMDILAGEFPRTYQEGYVTAVGVLGDRRFVPLLLDVLGRCEDAQSIATTIAAIGRLYSTAKNGALGSDGEITVEHISGLLSGYALSTNVEIATATVLTLESLGGASAERTLHELARLLDQDDSLLAAHVHFALLHIRRGETPLNAALVAAARDPDVPDAKRLCAIERLSGLCDRTAIETLAALLDDPTVERVRVNGYLTDDVVHVISEAAFMALMDCPIRHLVEVLGEDILPRLETFQMYSLPSWWLAAEDGGDVERFEQEF